MNYDVDIYYLLNGTGYTVFNTFAKQTQAAPYIVFGSFNAFENDTTANSKAQNETMRVQVSVFARNITERNTLSAAVKLAMEDKTHGALSRIEYEAFQDEYETETEIFIRNIDFITNCKIS